MAVANPKSTCSGVHMQWTRGKLTREAHLKGLPVGSEKRAMGAQGRTSTMHEKVRRDTHRKYATKTAGPNKHDNIQHIVHTEETQQGLARATRGREKC